MFNIFDKILGALNIKITNKKRFIKAGGNISAGGNIVIDNHTTSSPTITFRMQRPYISPFPPEKSNFGEIKTPFNPSVNVVKFEFLDIKNTPIGGAMKFEKLTSSSIDLIAHYRIENRQDEERFLKTLKNNKGEITARITLDNGDKFIYTFETVHDNWKKTLEGSQNLNDDFNLTGRKYL